MKVSSCIRFITLFITVVFLIFTGKAALAGSIVFGSNSQKMDFIEQTSQEAIINYKDGVEEMILGISLVKNPGRKSVWIFPIPSDSGNVYVSAYNQFPKLEGTNVIKDSYYKTVSIMNFLYYTQIYPLIYDYILIDLHLNKPQDINFVVKSVTSEAPSLEGVQIYQQYDMNDVETDIIRANSSQGIYNYLKKLQLDVRPGDIKALDSYIKEGYSFVISYASRLENESSQKELTVKDEYILDNFNTNLGYYLENLDKYPKFSEVIEKLKNVYPKFKSDKYPYSFLTADKYFGKEVYLKLYSEVAKDPSIVKGKGNPPQELLEQKNKKAVYISFPTSKIFFPLCMTSVYGEETIPITLKIMGHVTPQIYSNIQDYTDVSYFYKGVYTSSSHDLFHVDNYKGSNIDFTKIYITAPSKQFTDDLWIEKSRPNVLITAYSLMARTTLIFVFFWFVFSIIIAVVLGKIVFFKNNISLKKLVFFGKQNLFTFPVFCFSVFSYRATNNNLKESTPKVYLKIIYVVLFSLSFLLATKLVTNSFKITMEKLLSSKGPNLIYQKFDLYTEFLKND